MTMTIKVILVVRAENDLSTELNVSWAGSSSVVVAVVVLLQYHSPCMNQLVTLLQLRKLKLPAFPPALAS